MVARGRRAGLAPVTLGLLLAAVSACTSFDPVQPTRFKLLQVGENPDLGISGAHWHAYDDQHSRTSPCTNGAAGNHDPSQCAHLDPQPTFSWDGGKCPPSASQQEELAAPIAPETDTGRVCLQGSIEKLLHCVDGITTVRCNDEGGDSSNMWGAGIGFEFSSDGKQRWDGGGFRGVAFDLTIFPEGSTLDLRVEIPIVLAQTTPIPDDHPLTRDDGSLIGSDGQVYNYDCSRNELFPPPRPQIRKPIVLGDVLVPADTQGVVTSGQHPSGSPFWLLPTADPKWKPTWKPSPAVPGHNELEWRNVYPPPTDPDWYFDTSQLLGIQFHVVHPENDTPDISVSTAFHFCIENLALLE